jgi:MFS family permease
VTGWTVCVAVTRPPGERVAVSSSPARRASFHEVFAIGEFRALWASYVLSAGGDRLALVALTLLIYARTRSPLLAAVAFAAGYVPYVIGALFLSGVADRLPRREVMIACDVVRAVLVGAMLVPRMPLDALIALLYATTVLQPPFDAARSASLRDMVQGERYALAAAALQSTFRVVIVAGAAAGGITVALLGARPALAFDAATFVVSALLIRFGTGARPAAAAAAKSSPGALRQLGAGVRVVFGDSALRTLVMLGWLAAFYEIPSGIAVPYAGRLGGGPVAAGLLLAAAQTGAAVMTPVFTKQIRPLTRLRWMGPMAVCACGTLVLTVLHPGLAASMAIFALSGAFAMYQIAANTAFVERLPNERRAQAFGLANAGLVVGQGAAFALAGAAAEVLPPSTVIALGGGLGALAACGLALRWRHMSPSVGRHSARHLGRQAPLTRQAPVYTATGQAPVRAPTGQAPVRAATGQAPARAARSRLKGH